MATYRTSRVQTNCKPSERVQQMANVVLLGKQMGILKMMCCNLAKHTHCYKMIIIHQNHQQSVHFVKIFEDSTLSPIYFTTKLCTNASLKKQLSPYLLLPVSKPCTLLFNQHKYNIVKYPFIKHHNLQQILFNACSQNAVHPLYHKHNRMPHSAVYKRSILAIMSAIMTITIALKHAGFVDMDLSPDNFVIVRGKCMKIDHESTIKWQNKLNVIRVPIKAQFKAPEVNNVQLAPFDVEKASVYQIGACFIYMLYAQLQQISDNGRVYWSNDWDPKYLDSRWLAQCVDKDPIKRPTYVDIAREIKWERIKLKRM